MILVIYLLGLFIVSFITAKVIHANDYPEEYTMILSLIMGAIWPVIMVTYFFQIITGSNGEIKQ